MSCHSTCIHAREPRSRGIYQPRKRTRQIYWRKVKACADQLLLPFRPIALGLAVCHRAAAHYTRRFAAHIVKHFKFLRLHRIGEHILAFYKTETQLLKITLQQKTKALREKLLY